jgi:glycosyltransferase involved in cell wall biosynthesis
MSTKVKVLLVGPLCNISGYSEHARVLMDSLMGLEDEIDLYVQTTQWAAATWDLKYYEKYKSFIDKTNNLFHSRRDENGNVRLEGFFDASFQVKPPNEFEKISNNDVGVTAALETTFAPSQWVPKCNLMKHIFVVSDHAKDNLKNAKGPQGERVATPITVIPYGYDNSIEKEDIYKDLDITTSLNFLTIAQLAPRKNFENTLKWFVEQHEDNADAGLIVKTHFLNNSTLDFYEIQGRVKAILDSVNPDRKCKIYLLHGNFTEQQMVGLFDPDVVDCYITLTHGEGFGIPIFHAACNSIPVIATNWSGHLDFLRAPSKNKAGKTKYKSHFLKVDYDISSVQKSHLMPDLITPDCKWAYPRESSFKKNMRIIQANASEAKEDAKNLSEYLLDKFSIENIHKQYREETIKVLPQTSQLQNDVDDMFEALSLED